MRCPIFVVDAFTKEPFTGNPAGVCVLEVAAEEPWMQSVAAEMKHAETAFVWPIASGEFGLRWFTPGGEVDLCGHATLATSKVLWDTHRVHRNSPIRFQTTSGQLVCCLESDGAVSMDFPAEPPEAAEFPQIGQNILGSPPRWWGANRMDFVAVLDDEAQVKSFQPEMDSITRLGSRGLIITALGDGDTDYVLRFFAPSLGVPEDPVTGSANCALAPYWSAILGNEELLVRQLSERGGELKARIRGNRVDLIGHGVIVLEGLWVQ